jgi:hypothetical protein
MYMYIKNSNQKKYSFIVCVWQPCVSSSFTRVSPSTSTNAWKYCDNQYIKFDIEEAQRRLQLRNSICREMFAHIMHCVQGDHIIQSVRVQIEDWLY